MSPEYNIVLEPGPDIFVLQIAQPDPEQITNYTAIPSTKATKRLCIVMHRNLLLGSSSYRQTKNKCSAKTSHRKGINFGKGISQVI